MCARFVHRQGPMVWLAACSVLLWTSSSRASVVLAKFRHDRAGAISFTFDDGPRSQYDVAVRDLDTFGLKGSFYVIAGSTPDTQPSALVSWDQWAVALASGHEIGNHSMTHANLTTVSPGELQTEVVGAKQLIEQKLGVAPLTFVCPYNAGRFDPTISSLILEHHIARRTTEYCYGAVDRDTQAKVDWVADDAVANKKWNVPMIHGIAEAYSPLDPIVYYNHLAYCKALVDAGDLWVDTFATLSRYTQERDDVEIDVQSTSGSRVVFTATGTLDAAVFDYPLTFIVGTMPDTAVSATVIREGSLEDMPLTIETNRILVDAAPAPGAITVAWTTDAANQPPVVDAGGDTSVVAGGTLDFSGFVTDATVPGELVSHWELVSGPGPALFDPPDSETASATFAAAGEYVIRLCADDGELVAYDAVTVTVWRPASDSDGGGCQVSRHRPAPLPTAVALAAMILGACRRARRRDNGYSSPSPGVPCRARRTNVR